MMMKMMISCGRAPRVRCHILAISVYVHKVAIKYMIKRCMPVQQNVKHTQLLSHSARLLGTPPSTGSSCRLHFQQKQPVSYPSVPCTCDWRIWRRMVRTEQLHSRNHIGIGTGRGRGRSPPPTFQGGGRKEVSAPPPTFGLAHISRSRFFHPHNSIVLTPNQSVRRCFEKFIGVGTGKGRITQPPPPQRFSSVCVLGGGALMLEAPSGQFFSVQRYNILHNRCVSV